MKTIALLCMLAAVTLAGYLIRTWVVASYRMENGYTSLWQLADKSSTIPAKQEYIAKFVAALNAGQERGDFASHNALWLKTPNNAFATNLQAVTTLAHRLEEIQRMSPTSFEYNTAIQQITAQEQGQAGEMIAVFEGCYTLNQYPLVWDWIGCILIVVAVGLFGWGFVVFSDILT